MQKISGILPASARIQSVDMSDSHSVRPGAPSFGRPEGSSSLAKPALIASNSQRAGSAVNADMFSVTPMARWKAKDLEKVDIVDQVSSSFFHNRLAAVPAGNEAPPQEEVGFASYSPSSIKTSVSQAYSQPQELSYEPVEYTSYEESAQPVEEQYSQQQMSVEPTSQGDEWSDYYEPLDVYA